MKHYSSLSYHRVLVPNGEGGYLASVLELPGCFTEGDSANDAVSNLDELMEAWIEVEIEAGHAIPSPLKEQEISRSPIRSFLRQAQDER